MSDMAANTTGHKKTDHLRIVGLAELAVEFRRRGVDARRLFSVQGFPGRRDRGELVTRLKRDYAVVRHIKPQSSRADSAELYVLATGFRAAASPAPPPDEL